jgi:hypothetical protein
MIPKRLEIHDAFEFSFHGKSNESIYFVFTNEIGIPLMRRSRVVAKGGLREPQLYRTRPMPNNFEPRAHTSDDTGKPPCPERDLNPHALTGKGF